MESKTTLFTGFLSTSTVTFMHLQDLLAAIILGFFGAAGAYLFKFLIERFKK